MTFLEVSVSFANLEDAERIARRLLGEHLIACANILPCNSLYHWKGKIEEAQEAIGVFKTDDENYPTLEKRVAELHPYEVPMIVAIPIHAGSESYLDWIKENVTKEK